MGRQKVKITAPVLSFLTEHGPTMPDLELASALATMTGNPAWNRRLVDYYRRCYGIYKTDPHAVSKMQLKTNGYRQPRVPIGTVSLRKSGGFYAYDIKLGERKWIRYNRYLWEQAYGKIPDGYRICFKDGNTQNCTLENLECLPISDIMRRAGRLSPKTDAVKAKISATKKERFRQRTAAAIYRNWQPYKFQ